MSILACGVKFGTLLAVEVSPIDSYEPVVSKFGTLLAVEGFPSPRNYRTIMVLVLACGVKVRVRDPPPRFGGLPLAKGGRNILILIPQYVPHMLVHFYVE